MFYFVFWHKNRDFIFILGGYLVVLSAAISASIKKLDLTRI